MRLGAVFPQVEFDRVDPDEVVAFVRRLEDAGYDHLLAYDHVVGADVRSRPGWDGAYDSSHPFLEPLVLFAFLVRSCAVELVTDVLVLPQRQTALVAKQVATLALLAPGRLRLGVGIGWNEVEYDALGIDFGRRAERIEEQIALLRRLWTEPTVDHVGASERIDAAGIAPLLTAPVPIWVGCGHALSALERVGRLADGWLPMPTIQPGGGLDAALLEVRRAALEAGRDPDAIAFEGNVWAPPDRAADVEARVGRWRDQGAAAVAINTLRAGLRWPDQHLDALLRAADVAREEL